MFYPKDKTYKMIDLGLDIGAGEQLQVIIPAGTIFGAHLKNIEGYCLIGCAVTPGFNFDDFTLIERQDMIGNYPNHEEVINKLTK